VIAKGGLPLAVAIAGALAPGPALAFASAAGGRGLYDVRSADVPPSGAVDVQVSGSTYGTVETNGLGARDVDVTDGALQVDVGLAGIAEVWGSFGSAVLSVDAEDYRAISVRDGRVGAKVRLADGRVMAGLAMETSLPWGNRPRGFSTDSFDPAVTALLTVPLPESSSLTGASLHLNVGWRHHGDARGRDFEGWPLYYLEPVYPASGRDRVDLRAGLELSGRRTTLFAEALLDQILNDDLAFRESGLFLTPGFRYALSESFSFLVASKIAISSDDPSTTRYKAPEDVYPDWQVGFALAWSRRGAGADRDGDGIPDFRDRCPRDAEDHDGWQDLDGCPDPDDDGDGVPDEVDAAPRAAEDRDGYRDEDGAPDPDNDGDGIVDAQDRCPDEAEDLDGVADADGCPETDADGDGLPDEKDKCPEQAETVNGVEDDDGCPDQTSSGPARRLPGVTWDGAAVQPKPTSFFDLNKLAETMLREPEMTVEIRVVSEESGPPSPGGAGLARLRAEYLKAFLIAAGVTSERVRATGVRAEGPARSADPEAAVPRAEIVESRGAAPAPPPK
jgi:hypothetical protein